MMTAVAMAGFFMAIAGALHFSSWAEAWLASDTSRSKHPALPAASAPADVPLATAK